jgi:hypothetical protein
VGNEDLNEKLRAARGRRLRLLRAKPAEQDSEPPVDLGAGVRNLSHGSASPRSDGRSPMNAWLYDRARKIATRTEQVTTIPRADR